MSDKIQTPIYVFSQKKIIENYANMKKLLSPCDVYYALKACSELAILPVLNNISSGFDVASMEEYQCLRALGVMPPRIICSLPIKTEAMIEALYKDGCRYFVFDSVDEYIKLKKLAPEANRVLRLSVMHWGKDMIQFGIEKKKLFKHIDEGVIEPNHIDGVTFYCCDNLNIDRFIEIIDYAVEVIDQLPMRRKPFIFNIGGNFRETRIVGENYYNKLSAKLEEITRTRSLKLLAEPGRGVIDSAGTLIVSVVALKEREGGFTDVYIDAGFPAGVVKEPSKVEVLDKVKDKKLPRKIYRCIGITCNHRTLFYTPMKVHISVGDQLMYGRASRELLSAKMMCCSNTS